MGWLSSQINFRRKGDYSDLLDQMHEKEFVWIVANDDNRMQDGLDLRREYFNLRHVKHYVDVDVLGYVSVLEVLIGLSRRLSFQTSTPAEDWAYELLRNLELHDKTGHLGHRRAAQVDDMLEALIYRTYDKTGQGGFFPLAWPTRDQRKVEIWYQMAAYLNEQHDPHDI